uniref:Putative secreted protein n=1 Tax=Anopheles triannulatus TaxID=58253 RepID=A0A2M4B5Y3_9DIPT
MLAISVVVVAETSLFLATATDDTDGARRDLLFRTHKPKPPPQTRKASRRKVRCCTLLNGRSKARPSLSVCLCLSSRSHRVLRCRGIR